MVQWEKSKYWSNKRKVNILKWIGLQMNLNLVFRFYFFHIFVLYMCFRLFGLWRLIMVWAFFVSSFYSENFLIGVWSFLIPGFVFVNVLLELIDHENLWPLHMFAFCFFYACTSMYFVCVYLCIHSNMIMNIHTRTHIYLQGCCFSFFFSLSLMRVRMYSTPQMRYILV